MATVVFYISGHGYGHASRQVAIIESLLTRCPGARIAVRTSAPQWLFERPLGHRVEILPGEVDTGVAQTDSLTVDVPASIARAAAFHDQLDRRSAADARRIAPLRPDLVVADIPALGFTVAARLGVPAAAVGNFTWDWIYEGYPSELTAAPALVPAIRRAYRTAARAWRLPMHGGFAAFDRVVDTPLVAHRARADRDTVRRAMGLPGGLPLALVSFGRYGLDRIDWRAVARVSGYGVVVTDERAPDGAATPPVYPVSERALTTRGLSYTDLLAAVDAVVTKPGYGTIADCAANDTAMLYTSRGRFVEYERLVEAMPRFIRSAHIAQETLFGGNWAPALDALLAQPRPPTPDIGGARVVADGILTLAGGE